MITIIICICNSELKTLFALVQNRHGNGFCQQPPAYSPGLAGSQPLHFGDYGGMPMKTLPP